MCRPFFPKPCYPLLPPILPLYWRYPQLGAFDARARNALSQGKSPALNGAPLQGIYRSLTPFGTFPN